MDRLILNCDLGEDESLLLTGQLLALVDAANIGCGYHAGSLEKTRATIELAHKAGVLIGAHPGLPTDGGRGDVLPTVSEFQQLLKTQIGSFQQAAQSLGTSAQYIKLHGSLYHAVESDDAFAAAYIDFLKLQPIELAVFALARGRFSKSAEANGLRVYREAFADRAYQADGSLLPRSESQAVLSAAEALQRFRHWREQGRLPINDGGSLHLKADTLCVHGDSQDALRMIQRLHEIIRR